MAEDNTRSSSEEKQGAPDEKKGDASEALVTEKPVPAVPEKPTSQYVVTIDNQTGETIKIEKLDDETGARKELTDEEYSAFSEEPYSDESAGSADDISLMQAYHQGVVDYLNSLAEEES